MAWPTLVLVGAVALSACGDETDSAQVSTDHNGADVAFAAEMIPHHAQAIEMVDMTQGRPLSPQVQELADGISAAQGPEIEVMTDWLADWDEEVPDVTSGHADHDMDESMQETGSDMAGMMSADDMTALSNASDESFEAMWLDMMIEHHLGAVEMATTETEDGQYRPAVDLATEIIDSQTAEIEAMQDLLDSQS